MPYKILVVILLLAVVASLFSGLFFLHRDRGDGGRTVRALTLRVVLSLLLFAVLLFGYRFGYLTGYSQ